MSLWVPWSKQMEMYGYSSPVTYFLYDVFKAGARKFWNRSHHWVCLFDSLCSARARGLRIWFIVLFVDCEIPPGTRCLLPVKGQRGGRFISQRGLRVKGTDKKNWLQYGMLCAKGRGEATVYPEKRKNLAWPQSCAAHWQWAGASEPDPLNWNPASDTVVSCVTLGKSHDLSGSQLLHV